MAAKGNRRPNKVLSLRLLFIVVDHITMCDVLSDVLVNYIFYCLFRAFYVKRILAQLAPSRRKYTTLFGFNKIQYLLSRQSCLPLFGPHLVTSILA